MTTGYEVQMYQDISSMARSLNRIANALEANEARARKLEESDTMTIGEFTTPEEIEVMGQAIAAVRRGFASMEEGDAHEEAEAWWERRGHQPKTKGELMQALGGDIKALQDPYVQHLLATLPEEETDHD